MSEPSPAEAPNPSLALVACVAVGGGLGAVARLAVINSPPFSSMSATPWLNALGGLIAGCIVAACTRRHLLASKRFAFIVPGFCGGFTTFAGVASDIGGAVTGGRTGHALLHAVAAVLIGLFAGWLGHELVTRHRT